MEPTPETRQVLEQLLHAGEHKVPAELLKMGRRAVDIVPDCVGLSVGLLRYGLTFTLTATSPEVAGLDAVQYLDGGPCVDVGHDGHAIELDDLLDEDSWRMFAEASAAVGVRSTLTLPLLTSDGSVMGSVNLYASTSHAFEGHVDELAAALGSSATEAVLNADLSFSTRLVAAEAPQRFQERAEVDVALGMIAESQGVSLATARERLRAAASRAGISEALAARAIRGMLQQ